MRVDFCVKSSIKNDDLLPEIVEFAMTVSLFAHNVGNLNGGIT